MKLFTKKVLSLLSMIWLAHFSLQAQTTKEVVEITIPGSLQEVLDNLESSRFESLTIKGGLNAADIAYLRSGQDKVAMIETLDLSEVTLVPGDESYNTINMGRNPGAPSGYLYYIYYISDTNEIYKDSKSNGLGGVTAYHHIFCNDLSGAFSGCTAFEKVILPKSLPNVGEYLFGSINSSNSNLKEVVMPENAKVIGTRAFRSCGALEQVELPADLISIGSEAFYYTGVKEMNLPSTVRGIGDNAFNGSEISTINLDNVESIGSGAFYFAKNLTGIINISKLDTIQSNTFSTTNITDVIFSPALKIIGESAFSAGWGGHDSSYPKFKSLEFPDGLERIGSGAFSYCRDLEEVKLPNTITQIGASAFSGTPWVKTVGSEEGVTYIANVAYAYDNSYTHTSDTFKFREGTIAICDDFSFPAEIKENVKVVELPESLLEIGNNAFNGFKKLGEVKLPASLKRIGQQAFAECPKFWCTLPESLETLEYQAFYNCSTLSQATLPENLQFIGGDVFAKSALGTLRVYSRDLHYQFLDWEMGESSSLFEFGNTSLKRVIIGPQVSRLYGNMFRYTYIEKVEFEEYEKSALKYVGDNCFVSYGGATIYNLPSGITHIGDYAFCNCKFNGSLQLNEVKHIGGEAFGGTGGFESLVIPESVETIGGEAFYSCKDLKDLIFNAANSTTPSYSSYNSYRELSSPYIFKNCDSLRNVKIGPKVRRITWGMFEDCDNIESVTFAPSDTRSAVGGDEPLAIQNYAFNWCRKLNSLELPERVDSLGEYFVQGTQLKTISIPSSCRYLGKYAFDWCPIESIYFNSEIPPTFGGPLTDREWAYAQELTIYVPEQSLEFYKSECDLWKYSLVGVPDAAVDEILSSDGKLSIVSVYDLCGRNAFDRWIAGSKGVFILRLSNGSTRKVVR